MRITIPRSADYSLYRTVSRLKNVSEREDITVEQLKPFINKLADNAGSNEPQRTYVREVRQCIR